MKRVATMALGIGIGALVLTGCNSDTADKSDTIVGKWAKACYQPSGGSDAEFAENMTRNIEFTSDGNFTGLKVGYSDENCTEEVKRKSWKTSYIVGGATKDDQGKETKELDVSWKNDDGTKGAHYTMFRFKSDGNLLLSSNSETNDGKTKDKRANHIKSSWRGYTKQ